MNIVSKTLSHVAAVDYLIELLSQIEVGGTDVRQVLFNGAVSAFVPDSTPENRLYDFKHGGVLMPAELGVKAHSSVQPVPNSAEFVAKELVQFKGLECLIHDPLKEIYEASEEDGEPMLVEGSLFYLNRCCTDSAAECQKAIRRNTLSWHFLMFLGSYSGQERLSRNAILQNSTCVVVGAYDGESYLIWRRN